MQVEEMEGMLNKVDELSGDLTRLPLSPVEEAAVLRVCVESVKARVAIEGMEVTKRIAEVTIKTQEAAVASMERAEAEAMR